MSLSIPFATGPSYTGTQTVTILIHLKHVFFNRIIFAYAIRADAQHSTHEFPFLARQPKRQGFRSQRLYLFYRQ
jgi:hypothetical protein